MFEKLIIRNFQSHQKSILTFHEGVNVIIGQSDSGKTAIIRALRWLIWNRPGGDSFRSSWGGKTQIALSVEGGTKLLRIKDTSENEYWMDDEVYTAFGTDVPEVIQSVLNINEINLQSQLDAPFLLSESPGVVASHFNKVAHLDQIDVSVKKVQTWLNDLNRKVISTEEDIVTLKEEVETYKYLDKMEAEVEVLEDMQSRLQTISNQYIKLSRLGTDITNTEAAIQTYKERTKPEKEVDAILSQFDELNALQLKQQSLKDYIKAIEITKEWITKGSKIIPAEKEVDDILDMMEQANKIKTQQIALGKIIKDISVVYDSWNNKEQAVYDMQFDLDGNMPDICPLCDQPIKNK